MQNEEKIERTTAYIGLGSNLGDRAGALREAVRRIGSLQTTRVIAVSDLLENPAVGGPVDSPAFLNAAAEIQTGLTAQELLRSLLSIEQSLGRFRRQKWEPRPIDLDILLYGNEIIREENLTVPHPLMHQREFVLRPLAQIAPQAAHPVLRKTIIQLMGERC